MGRVPPGGLALQGDVAKGLAPLLLRGPFRHGRSRAQHVHPTHRDPVRVLVRLLQRPAGSQPWSLELDPHDAGADFLVPEFLQSVVHAQLLQRRFHLVRGHPAAEVIQRLAHLAQCAGGGCGQAVRSTGGLPRFEGGQGLRLRVGQLRRWR